MVMVLVLHGRFSPPWWCWRNGSPAAAVLAGWRSIKPSDGCDDMLPDVPVGGPDLCGEGLLLLLLDVDNLSTHFSFFSSNFRIYSSFSGMSRLELDSSGSGPGVQAGCHLLPAGPGLWDGGEPPSSEGLSTRSR